MKAEFLKKGYTKIDNLILADEVVKLRVIYDELLNNKLLTKGLRSDLGGGDSDQKIERITQIMRPSTLKPELLNSYTYKLVLNKVKEFLGDDMELDFDMLINKAPFTDTETPWHQDAAYWINMPDKRSISCWIALDKVYKENGCMWFVAKSNNELKEHKQLVEGGPLSCNVDINNAEYIPLNPGGCTFHDGFTLHFSKGNSTSNNRRALILNFRPQKMIDLERSKGIDHTGKRKARNTRND